MKKMIQGLSAHMLRIEEKVDRCTEHAETAAMKVKGSSDVDNDSALLGIPWKSAQNAWDAMDSLESRTALRRLLHASKLTKKQSNIASMIIEMLFDPELIGKLYCGSPRG